MIENLLQETIEVLNNHNRTLNDVICVCDIHKDWDRDRQEYIDVSGRISVEDFKKIANRKYDSGYGRAEVNENLLIIGDDFWLERREYDGSEWWEYQEFPDYKNIPEGKITIFYNDKTKEDELREKELAELERLKVKYENN